MKMIKIGNIAKVFNGYAFKSSEYSDEGFQVIRITNVQSGYIVNNNPKFIKLTNEQQKKFILAEGDILISLTGNVGRVGRIGKENLPAVLNQRVGKLIIHSKEVFPDYLFHILNNNLVEAKLIENAKGIAQKNIGSSDIEKIEIPLPSLEDQKRIVKILDAADALRQKRKKVIKLLDDYLKSVFLEMFGDPVTNTKKIKTYRGSDLFKFSSGKFNPTKNLSDGFKYPTYGGNGITGYSKDYLIDYDTLVIGRVGAYCGCVHKTSGKIWITDNAIFVKDFKQEVNLEFMNFQFKFLKFNKFADFSGQPKITQKPLEKTEYLAPPLEAQKIFDEIVKKTEFIKQKMLIQSQELETQFQALMQKAFKGEL